MIVSEFVGKVFIHFKGKPDTKAPAVGSPKWNMYLSTVNDVLSVWAENPQYSWRSLRSTVSEIVLGGKVDLPDDFLRLTDDSIYVGDTKLTYLDYEERNSEINGVYIDGWSPQRLILTSPADHEGKVLRFGMIAKPRMLTSATDKVVCDSEQWLIMQTAAQIAFNDSSKQDNYPDLIGMANQKFSEMVKALTKRPKGSVRRVKSSHQRLGRSW